MLSTPNISDCSEIASNNLSRPDEFKAETQPPRHRQTLIPQLLHVVNSVLTLLGSASVLSDLLIATIIGTFAALA